MTSTFNDETPFRSTLDDPVETTSSRFNAAFWKEVLKGLPLVLGFLIWELTDETGLAICISCARSGWRPGIVGACLMWKDPHKTRGNITGTYHIGLAFVRWGLCAIAAIFALTILQAVWEACGGNPAGNQGIQWQTMNLALIGFLTLFIGSLAIGTACVNARKISIRLWSNSDLYRQCLSRQWPIELDQQQTLWVIITVRGMTLIGCLILTIFLCHGLMLAIVLAVCLLTDGPQNFERIFPIAVFGSLLISVPLGIRLAWTSIALNPQQCWPELNFSADEFEEDANDFE